VNLGLNPGFGVLRCGPWKSITFCENACFSVKIIDVIVEYLRELESEFKKDKVSELGYQRITVFDEKTEDRKCRENVPLKILRKFELIFVHGL
jgi:hypothetical protein